MYFYLIPEKTLNYNHKKNLYYSGDGERPGEKNRKITYSMLVRI